MFEVENDNGDPTFFITFSVRGSENVQYIEVYKKSYVLSVTPTSPRSPGSSVG